MDDLRPTAILLDLGDTLATADPSWHAVYGDVLDAHDMHAEPDDFEAAFREVWSAWDDQGPFEATEEASFRRLSEFDRLILARLGHTEVPDSFFIDVDRAFRRLEAFRVFPEVHDVLSELVDRGFRLGLVSNWSWYAPEILETLGLARFFETMSISAHVGYVKPHAAIFEDALAKLGLGAADAVHVGDDVHADADGATGVGIQPLLIDRRGRLERPAVTRTNGASVPVIDDLTGLLDLLGAPRPPESVTAS